MSVTFSAVITTVWWVSLGWKVDEANLNLQQVSYSSMRRLTSFFFIFIFCDFYEVLTNHK